jgi:hypothetical protein
MLADGVPPGKALVMYGAVYHFGPRWATLECPVPPPPRTLREDEFDRLQQAIESRGELGGPPMTVEEVEQFGRR